MKDNRIDHEFYKQLQNDVNRIEKKSDKYRSAFYWLRILLLVIAGAITVISGWNGVAPENSNLLLNILLILGAVTTTATALDTLFQVETKKNTYKLMLIELREIRSELVYYHNFKNSELEDHISNVLFPKYKSIMAYSKALIEREKDADSV